MQKLDRSQAHQLGQPRPDAAEADGHGRPGQPVPGRLALGLRHGRHQHCQGQGRARRPADARQRLEPDLRPEVRGQAQGLRRQLPRLGVRGAAGRAAATSASRPTARNAADYDAAGKMLQKVRPYVTRFSSSGYINDLAGGLAVRGDGLFGRHQHRPRPRASKPTRSGQRHRGARAQGRRDAVLRLDGDPEGRAERRTTRTCSSTTSCAPRCRGADEQGLLRQPERGLAEVREEGRRRQQDDLPARRRPGPDDAARCACRRTIRRVQTRIFTNFKAGR